MYQNLNLFGNLLKITFGRKKILKPICNQNIFTQILSNMIQTLISVSWIPSKPVLQTLHQAGPQ